VTVTAVPTAAELGETLLIVAVGNTVKANPLLGVPLTVTTTFPLVAPTGTFTVIEVSLHPVTSLNCANVPLKLTVLPFCAPPKFAPVMVTGTATAAELGEMLVMPGVGNTVNAKPLLGAPPTVTTTFPLVAFAGTFTVIEVAFQLVMSLTSAGVPLKVTELPF
jgi:hypothetical protein